MRDSAGAEYRLESKPDHFAVGLTLTGSWIPQTFLKKVKGLAAVTDHPAELWGAAWEKGSQKWRDALQAGDVDAAWDCWNDAATSALGLQAGDRGVLKVKQTKSPVLQRDPTVTQDLQIRHDLETAWYRVQEEKIPLAHWPSAAGPYVSTRGLNLSTSSDPPRTARRRPRQDGKSSSRKRRRIPPASSSNGYVAQPGSGTWLCAPRRVGLPAQAKSRPVNSRPGPSFGSLDTLTESLVDTLSVNRISQALEGFG
eukprot:3134230-Amphidinium_carterae.1